MNIESRKGIQGLTKAGLFNNRNYLQSNFSNKCRID